MAKKKAPSFEAGFAAALGELVRIGHIDQVEVQDALEGAGYTVEDLKKAGADEYDLSEIQRVLG